MNERTRDIRVLVIEDNDDVRNIISVYLKSKGFTVLEAADGQTGLDMAIRNAPSVILLDILIPKLDGIETLQGIRHSVRTAHVPVIMMSAVLQTRDIESETKRLKVSSFLQKPFQVRQLIEHIDNALSSSAPKVVSVAPRSVISSDARAVTLNAGSPVQPLTAARKVYCKQEALPARGTLNAFPLPRIVHSVFSGKQTGCLRIFFEGAEKRVYFQNGYPVYAESSLASETLGAYLMREHKLTNAQHQHVQVVIGKTGIRYGEALLNENLIGPHELYLSLEAHLTEKIVSCFSWFEGQFAFDEDDHWKDDVIVVKMKPGRIILDGIYAYWQKERLNAVKVLQMSNIPFLLSDELYSAEDLSLTTLEAKVRQMAKQNLSVFEILENSADVSTHLKTAKNCQFAG